MELKIIVSYKIEKLNKELIKKEISDILNVWESSVRATHFFLKESDIMDLKPLVEQGTLYVDEFFCIRNNEEIIAFIGIHEDKIEMLFVSDDFRGKGIGQQLINFVISNLNVKYVDVNEQNPEGTAFYEYMGFSVFKRSEFDDHGNPYPILHMKLNK